MIRAGREVVDRHEVALLHGLTESQAHRQQPWRQAGYPAPVNGQRKLLWDKEQVVAFIEGRPIPALPAADSPENGSPEDLLDRFEAAALAGLTPAAWESGHQRGTFPQPDDDKYGMPHWYRRTVEEFVAFRANRGSTNPSGRPKGTTGSRPAKSLELEQRIRELLAELERDGRPVVKADIARRLDIHVNTLNYHLGQMRNAGATTPVRPG